MGHIGVVQILLFATARPPGGSVSRGVCHPASHTHAARQRWSPLWPLEHMLSLATCRCHVRQQRINVSRMLKIVALWWNYCCGIASCC